MRVEAVLVSFNVKGTPCYSKASGVLLSNNFVITTGTILIPLLQISEQRKLIASFFKSSSSRLEMNKSISKVLFRVFRERENDNESNKINCEKIFPLESKVVGVWKCPLVSQSLETLFDDWSLGHFISMEGSRDQLKNDIDISKELMSIFILLRCEGRGDLDLNKPKDKSDEHILAFLELMPCLTEPDRGQEVEIISTPFGSELFFNSLSRGVISTVVGSKKCCILTDARTVSGCEGGPIFTLKRSRKDEKEKDKLLGLVTCPVTSWRGEWVGLTIGISLLPVLKRLLQLEEASLFSLKPSNRTSDLLLVEIIDETVLLIRCGSSWGSGVVLNSKSGTIITCSHVVKNHKDVTIFYKKNYYPAKVLFSSRDDVAYDLAVIQTIENPIFEKEMMLCKKPPKLGDAVIAAGFPLISERDDFNLQPSIVSGCVAQVNPFMIQTTCCIQSGFSGGALLRDEKLLGIIVCNTRDSAADVLFPHINFAIPSSVFRDSISRYIKTKDVQWLKNLECFDPNIQSVWKFQTSKL